MAAAPAAATEARADGARRRSDELLRRPRRSSSPAAPAAWARRPPRRPRPPWPPSATGARCWSSPSTRPGGWPTPSGSTGIGNAEHRVPDEAFRSAGVHAPGRAVGGHARHQGVWDDLIRRHAPDAADPATRSWPTRSTRTSPGRFVQSHDYIAMERLYEIHSEGDYDLIVVDTPPTRNALDFLEAPAADGRLLLVAGCCGWLIVPYRSPPGQRRPPSPSTRSPTGSSARSSWPDIAEFFILFQTMYDGFVERAEAVEPAAADRRTTFIVVSTLEAAPAARGRVLRRASSPRASLHLGAIVLNKVLPDYLREPTSGARLAERLTERAEPSWPRRPGRPIPARRPDQIARVLTEVAESFLQLPGGGPPRGRAAGRALGASPDVLATVPFFDTDIYDLAGLVRLGEQIWD